MSSRVSSYKDKTIYIFKKFNRFRAALIFGSIKYVYIAMISYTETQHR